MELRRRAIRQFRLFDRRAVNLLAVSRKGRRITHRLRGVKLRAGERHELDAVHCKACGKLLKIPDEGL